MKIRFLVSFFLFSFVTYAFGGFVAGTLIKTPHGYLPIEQLHKGDAVVSIVPDQSEHLACVAQVRFHLSEDVYQFVVDSESFACDGGQKLYDPVAQEWIKTNDLIAENVLSDSQGYYLSLLSLSKLPEPNIVYELSVESPHTFLVGRSEVLVHNVGPVVFGISFAFGAGGISLEGITCAIAGIGLATYNFFKSQKKVKVKPYIETFTPPAPNPDPDNEKEKKDNEKEKQKFEIPENSANHMFKKEPGHFPFDTPINRQRLIEMVADKDNYCGPDCHGNACYEKIVEGGKQLWAYVRGNFIRDGGLNEVPIEYNEITGFSRQFSPRAKF